MLARFENGYFLEVNVCDGEYNYTVYDEDGIFEDEGSTEYRSMEMFHPKNEIDYILEFCEPDCVKGKYELLGFEDVDDYLDSLDEDPDGEWILERQGYEEDIRNYRTFEAAQRVMKEEYEEICGDDDSYHMENNIYDNCAVIGDEEYYQSWKIYEEKTFDNPIQQKFYEIQKEIDRTDVGVSQYAFELMSTDVVRDHLYKVERLIDELKEMI